MSIDINKIVQAKISDMEENGEIKKHLEDKVEALILDSVSYALDDYNLKRKIREKVEQQISPCLDTLNFSGYNLFICQKIKQISEDYLSKDISLKVVDMFEKMFIHKRESIKLSEIFEAYREWITEHLDDDEKYEYDNEFYASVDIDNDYTCFIDCVLSKTEPEKSYLNTDRKDIYAADYGFTISKYTTDENGRIFSVYFNGNKITDFLKVASYNKFETLLLNLYYNETP
ncbi:MAG: hypothetical protein IJA12_02525, partial [Oscillospiraceae bacterium]|nr:hypothetical protein [Oscillospiraceae bacterium]